MSDVNPLKKSKDQFSEIIKKIGSKNSAVGIDAPLTHAIIINYLQQISDRLNALEKAANKQ